MRVEEEIDRLKAALELRKLPAPEPADASGILAQISEAVEPYSLPAELVRMWELIKPWTVEIRPFPAPSTPEFALWSWISHQNEFRGMYPPTLFSFGYESHQEISVELAGPETDGGCVFEWSLVDGPFELRFASVSDWLSVWTECIEDGAFNPAGSQFFIDSEEFKRRADRKLTESGSPPPYVSQQSMPREKEEWPTHWIPDVELGREEHGAHGKTHSIADIRSSRSFGSIEARIHGRVQHQGEFPEGSLVEVIDDSGSLNVLCTARDGYFSEGSVQSRYFEFDIVASTEEEVEGSEPLVDPEAELHADLPELPEFVKEIQADALASIGIDVNEVWVPVVEARATAVREISDD